jgi:hypothetical protein
MKKNLVSELYEMELFHEFEKPFVINVAMKPEHAAFFTALADRFGQPRQSLLLSIIEGEIMDLWNNLTLKDKEIICLGAESCMSEKRKKKDN